MLRSRRKQKGKKRGHQENTGGFKFFKRKQKNKKPNGYWESVNANRHLGSAANVTMGHIAPLPRPNQVSRISLVSRGHVCHYYIIYILAFYIKLSCCVVST